MAETRQVPVVIVGGGPVGLVLAIDLAHRGVATAVLESSETPRSFPKGNTHNARTMEHYRRLGLADSDPAGRAAGRLPHRRRLLHDPQRLRARPHPDALVTREGRARARRGAARSGAGAHPPRQPDVRGGDPLRAARAALARSTCSTDGSAPASRAPTTASRFGRSTSRPVSAPSCAATTWRGATAGRAS